VDAAASLLAGHCLWHSRALSWPRHQPTKLTPSLPRHGQKLRQKNSFCCQECTDGLIKSNAQAKHILAQSPTTGRRLPPPMQGAPNLCTSCTLPHLGLCCSSEGSKAEVRAYGHILAPHPWPIQAENTSCMKRGCMEGAMHGRLCSQLVLVPLHGLRLTRTTAAQLIKLLSDCIACTRGEAQGSMVLAYACNAGRRAACNKSQSKMCTLCRWRSLRHTVVFQA
jgi:hypothetical protein